MEPIKWYCYRNDETGDEVRLTAYEGEIDEAAAARIRRKEMLELEGYRLTSAIDLKGGLMD